MKFTRSLFLILLLVCTVSLKGFSQGCAACKSAVESDLHNGSGSIGTGLNTGILYLMAVPYIILMTGGYFFFKKPIDAKIKAWKAKRFPAKQVR